MKWQINNSSPPAERAAVSYITSYIISQQFSFTQRQIAISLLVIFSASSPAFVTHCLKLRWCLIFSGVSRTCCKCSSVTCGLYTVNTHLNALKLQPNVYFFLCTVLKYCSILHFMIFSLNTLLLLGLQMIFGSVSWRLKQRVYPAPL